MRLIVGLLLAILCFNCNDKKTHNIMSLTNLELQILDSIHSHEGVFAVAFKVLDTTSQSIFINKSEVFHAASTMKTPVMIEVFNQAEQGKLTLTDSLKITNRFNSIVDQTWYELEISDDSEPDLYQAKGQYKTIAELTELMITQSSNLASNILIDHLGAGNITRTMDSIDAGGMQVLRGVEDIKAFELGRNNTTNAISLSVIFEKMGRLELVSKNASLQMIEILEHQQFKDVIPALLPSDVAVAHKTGFITGVHHDSGIVFLPDGRKYVLVLLSKDLPNFESGTRLLQNISRMVFDYMQENRNKK